VSIFINPKQSLLDYINTANGTTRFTALNTALSVPQPVAGTWREGTTTKNTFVKATPMPGADFKGKTYLVYDRLQLGDFRHFRPVRTLPCYQVDSVHDILSNILYYYAIKLNADDVEDDPIVLDGEGKATVTVRAKPGSLIWLGSVTFDIIPGGALIDSYLQATTLNGLHYPVDDFTTQTSALIYTYGYDFSGFRDQFLLIDDGGVITQPQAQFIADALKTLDKGIGAALWVGVDATATLWNLFGATCVYNGLNSIEYASNPAYKYIMVLELAGTVTKPSGRFILHYNDPEDPNAIS
jgi:hypothetical protein